MTPGPGDNLSFWVTSTPETSYPRLEPNLQVDVAVIGGGILGITAAYLLQQEGRSVAVIEGDRIARGVTGYTTAKISSSQHLIYSQLVKKFGEDGARTYGGSNQAALERIAALVEELGIDCDFERQDNYVYTESASELDSVAAGRGDLQRRLPFGTFLAAAAVFASLWGQPIVDWYAGFYR